MQFSVPGESLEYLVIYGPTPEEILRKYTGAARPAGAAAAVVVRAVAEHVVHHLLRRGHRDQLRRRDGRPRPAAVGVPLRLLLDARVPLVRLHLGRPDLPRPGRHARPAQGEGAADLPLDQPLHRPALAAVRRRRRSRLPAAPARRRRVADRPVAGRHGHRRLHQPRRPRLVRRQAAAPCSTWASTASRPTSASASPPTWCGPTAPTRSGCTTTTPTSTTRRSSSCCASQRGEGEAVLFARSATAGGQQFPVHWGGDCESTFVSMAESLRGGLSLAASGFGFWSHDIGGFEGRPGPGGVQAVDPLRPALHPQPAARQRQLPGAVAVRRGVGRGAAPVHPAEDAADALPLRAGGRGARDRDAGAAADGGGVPRRPGLRPPGPAVHARRPGAGRAGVHRLRGDVVLPPRGDLDAPADRRHRTRCPRWVREVCDFEHGPGVRPARVGPPARRPGRPARLRVRRGRDAAGVRARRRGGGDGDGARSRR